MSYIQFRHEDILGDAKEVVTSLGSHFTVVDDEKGSPGTVIMLSTNQDLLHRAINNLKLRWTYSDGSNEVTRAAWSRDFASLAEFLLEDVVKVTKVQLVKVGDKFKLDTCIEEYKEYMRTLHSARVDLKLIEQAEDGSNTATTQTA